MAILYLGPNNCPDFGSDYLLSPIVGPDELLAQFPKTYFMCGEKDPFVDDTVVFAGRIREAKRKKSQMSNGGKFGEGLRMSSLDKAHQSENWVEVKIIQGVGHAFLIMILLLPESKGAVKICAQWLQECFQEIRTQNNTSLNNKVISEAVNEDDEGLVIAPRRSITSDITKHQPTNVDLSLHQNHENTTMLQLHTSHSLPNVFTPGEMTQKSSIPSQIHVSASEIGLSPGHEQERALWEQQNILNESEIMNRRRESLIRNLAEHSTFKKAKK
ncbi:244_t:CDS:1 [Acaulospora colombiana]|uniref:244_t:CDS:1 n=1 Tax=Acaulospora colombiana TaxID=27376 RepID=A0ACA9MHL5_9GLOM|nr:244_t:CDS:1 [Acaulospora colombiana]